MPHFQRRLFLCLVVGAVWPWVPAKAGLFDEIVRHANPLNHIRPGGALPSPVPAPLGNPDPVAALKKDINHLVAVGKALSEGRFDQVPALSAQHAAASLSQKDLFKEAILPMIRKEAPGNVVPPGMMETPKLQVVNPREYPGEAVVYVNGIGTSLDLAVYESTSLSLRLKRPVALLYSASSGIDQDLVGIFAERFKIFDAGPLSAKFGSAAKQLASIFYAGKPVSIISHSRGCVQVRNALMLASAFWNAPTRVAWVATGMPMASNELYVRTEKFRDLTAKSDTLAAQISVFTLDTQLQVTPEARRDHDFVENYLKEISEDDLPF